MNVKALCVCILLATAPIAAIAQGFAGMGATEEGFALPDPDTRFTFPKDHGSHPNFRIEWWYVTAILTGPDGETYGAQWTLFRNAIRPTAAESDQIWLGHAAVSTPAGHFHAERLARGGTGQASVTPTPFSAVIDEWALEGPDLSNVKLTAQGSDFAYDLTLASDRPFVPQGIQGFSQKSAAGLASHYYSQPFYTVEGTIELPSGAVAVTGQAWLDREWSSQPLTETQTGWDWISLHLDSGAKLMGYRLRDTSGRDYVVGTWIATDGTPSPFRPGDLTMKPNKWARVADRDVPVGWTVTLENRDLEIDVHAVYPQSWMPTIVPYWEGPVQVTGTHSGRGYLEMTGYE
jgi:predicted secreted hydrolase